eukprot:108263-Pyramimonas_sp.AAC.1
MSAPTLVENQCPSLCVWWACAPYATTPEVRVKNRLTVIAGDGSPARSRQYADTPVAPVRNNTKGSDGIGLVAHAPHVEAEC